MINDETPIKPATPAPSEPAVHSSGGLEVLRKYWNERIKRKRETAVKMAENGEYAPAHRLSVEADATELCLKDLNTESTSNAERSQPRAENLNAMETPNTNVNPNACAGLAAATGSAKAPKLRFAGRTVWHEETEYEVRIRVVRGVIERYWPNNQLSERE